MKRLFLFLVLAPHVLNAAKPHKLLTWSQPSIQNKSDDQLLKQATALSTLAAWFFFDQAHNPEQDPVTKAYLSAMALHCSLAPCAYICKKIFGNDSIQDHNPMVPESPLKRK